jgi:putative transposase
MTDLSDYRRGRHVVSALHVHWIFVTRYRRKVLTSSMIEYLSAVFGKVCEDFGADLGECNGEDDHVHLLTEYPPKVPVSLLVNSLKGASSRKLRQRYTVRTHRDHLWPRPTSPPHVAVHRHMRRRYVENQRAPGG